MPESLLVASRHESGAGGTAIRTADVAAAAANTVSCQRVNVGRRDILGAVHADIAITHVIADDE